MIFIIYTQRKCQMSEAVEKSKSEYDDHLYDARSSSLDDLTISAELEKETKDYRRLESKVRVAFIILFTVSIVLAFLNIFQFVIYYTNFKVLSHSLVNLPLIMIMVGIASFGTFFHLMNKHHTIYFREVRRRYLKYYAVFLLA